jgi:hypothetical protein
MYALTNTASTKLIRTVVALATLAAAAAMLAVIGPAATAQRPPPPPSYSRTPLYIPPSPWVLRFTGDGKVRMLRHLG